LRRLVESLLRSPCNVSNPRLFGPVTLREGVETGVAHRVLEAGALRALRLRDRAGDRDRLVRAGAPDSASMVEPQNSTAKPRAPCAPMRLMIIRMRSLAVVPTGSRPSTRMRMSRASR